MTMTDTVFVSLDNQWAFEPGMSEDEMKDRILESIVDGTTDLVLVVEDESAEEKISDDGDGGHLIDGECPECGLSTLFKPDSGDPIECVACGFQLGDDEEDENDNND
jgi:hypothetical protein